MISGLTEAGWRSWHPARVAKGAKADPVNVTLMDEFDEIVADLARFDHIWVRDLCSHAWARGKGLPVTLCPDLALTRCLQCGPRDTDRVAIIDSESA